MLGESVVVSGAGGGTLLRPRSADNLIRLAPATSLPALDDLAESEVFVGDEDEDVGFSHELRQGEEVYLRPSTMDQMLSHGSSSSGNNCDVTSSELLSPTGPTPTANLLITYHDEALRLPLDAVKEEVEAEALEEASMIMSSGPGSLSHVSLTSSVISNNSLDDSTLSSRTDTFDTVVAVPSSDSSPPPDVSNTSSPTPTKTTPTRPSNRDASRVSGTPTRTSPTSPRGSSGRSSPRTSTDSPRTPERRRKSATSSPRSDNSRGSTPRATAMRTTPRGADKTKGEDKKTPRGTGRSGSTTVERKHCARMQDSAFKRDSDKTYGHTHIKDHTENSKSSFFGRKKKPDAKDNKQDTDSKFNTIGRKKKDNKSEKEDVPEKYGTLGRRRKIKESGDTKDDCKDKLSKDTKNTLDMYATLPRRKAREMSARWREQMAAEEEAARPSLRRTKSVGKSETSSSITRGRASVMTSSMPSSSLTGLGRSRSPRTIHREAKSTSTSTFNARKERTIICMETGVQTSLTGGDLVSALRALSRQNSVGTEEDPEDTAETRPHVSIIREMKTPEDLPDRRHVEVQVELAWRLGDGELPEHVRRLTEEHTRLQTEHSRARSRLEEMEGIREELEKMKAGLDEERSEKEEVQGELDRTSQRVKDMLISMEGVEHEFNSRGDSLMELESQLHHSADIHVQMQERLNQYEEFALKYKRDLDKSVAAQKTLLQQVQDLENDGREMADFMAEEKNALAECLREAETELVKLRAECKRLSAKIKEKDDEARQMIRLAEERRNKYMILQSEMNSMQSRTRDMMVCQGAEVSGAAVALANLSSRLNTLIGKLIQDYSITETDLEMIVTPNESDSSASSTNGTPEHKSPYKISVQSPSPRKTASFITALINAMRLGPKGKLNQSGGLLPCNGNKQETEGRNSPEGSESHEVVEHDGNSGPSSSSSVSLTDQVTDVDILLTQFLKVCCVLKNDTDNRLMEIEDENDRLCNQIRSQQQVIDQQQADYENLNRSESRAKRELMVASRDLEMANQSLDKFYQADYELQVKKLQDEVERLGATIRHLEVLHTEKEKQLEESLSSLSAAQGPAPPNHVSEATHQQEIATLNDKVTSLRQSVIERDRRISELSERHSQDLATIRECQIEAHRSNRRLTTTVDHVLKTMESIPDIVSSNTTLKQLFATLAAAEKSNQQQQNGNINTQNGFGNTVNNKDLNANPQSIIDSGINNQKILTSIKAETHL